jgi:hypothetical protein
LEGKMEIKGLKIETIWNEEEGESLFTVTHDEVIIAEEATWSESPEDATLGRDFKWVEPLLHKVYALGKKDGYLEGLREAK